MGAGGLWEEIVALGVPRLSPAARVRALEEAIMVVRALSGGGDPVTFDGEFYRVTERSRARRPRSNRQALTSGIECHRKRLRQWSTRIPSARPSLSPAGTDRYCPLGSIRPHS
jgi:hypothetical protein